MEFSGQPQHQLIFFVNGKKVIEPNPDPEWTLLFYLRYKLRLVGSKEGCGEGGCGACTVIQSTWDSVSKTITNSAINACLTPVCAVHGTAIITVEGIGSIKTGLHPVQERIAKSHGTQCGFCTPGFVMSMYALLRNNPHPTEAQMEEAFQGNLCRCTGYRPIMEGFKTLCSKDQPINGQNGTQLTNGNGPIPNGNGCCMQNVNGKCCKVYETNGTEQIADTLFDESEFLPYDPTMEIIFPSELQLNNSYGRKSVKFTGPSVTWWKPTSLKELLELKQAHPDAKLVAGNTEIGVDLKFKKQFNSAYIQISEIPELVKIDIASEFVNVGSAVTLTKFEKFCNSGNNKISATKDGSVFKAIHEMLHWFGGKQVRNVATVGGNVITASPISDLNPIFMATNSKATFVSLSGTRTVPIDETFFKSYRTTVIKPDEVLLNISIPITKPNEFVMGMKQARRREDDISIVSGCFRITLDTNTLQIADSRLAFGGMAATTLVAKKSSNLLIGQKWTANLVDGMCKSLIEELALPTDAPGGMVAYRQSLAPSLFFKFFLSVNAWISSQGWSTEFKIDPRDLSAISSCSRGEAEGVQLYQIVPKDQKVHDLVGRPVVHLSGLKHATGEATYTDDVVPLQGELYGHLVLSTIAHGNILSIDATEALKVDGVNGFFSADSIPKEKNIQGFIIDDEKIFAFDEVTCQGQVIGIIVAKDQCLAEKAARLVKIKYEEKPAIVSMEQAVEQKSFLTTKKLRSGDADGAFQTCDRIVEGEMRIGGQEHFYMETHCCLAIPKEEQEMEVLISAQGLPYIQNHVAKTLGIPANRVTVKCRRMGGGFGGKESRDIIVALATSIAAHKLGKPVKTVMNRHDDMVATGGRHPFMCKYKVGCSKDGKISVMKITMFSNAGNSWDGSPVVMEKAILTFDSAYTVPNWDFEGFVCKTNLASNTAFRGYGGPQASVFCETIMDAVGESLGIDPFKIREMHLKNEGDLGPCGWRMENVTVRQCWEECVKNSDYFERKKAVEEFNSKNRWKKRGIAVMPMKHDIGFHGSFMNQAGALVMIYTDGSVSLNHGGVEMGQGLGTKMVQIVTRALDIPVEKVYFSETASDKVPNATATCGSMSSDLNGMAVMRACEKLSKRLEPFKKANPQGTWESWVNSAYMSRVNLSAIGFYEVDDVNWDFDDPKVCKNPACYTVYGVACSEVEIDCLTGDHSVLRTDIVIDAGESMNPAIDIGQIEGAFVQGYGLFMLEEHLYSPKGQMLTKGPGMYKIPSMGDIPRKFYISLLRGASNPKAVYSSKGLGEPPLFLSASIYFAVKEAIKASRKEEGHDTLFRLDCPATAERIRMACLNSFTVQPKKDEKHGGSWAIRA